MLIWILFLTVCYILLSVYNHSRFNNRQKTFFLVSLMVVCVYFSTFRDGLGSDYTAYQYYCERGGFNLEVGMLLEPIPELLYLFCYNSNISAVFFFFITSTIICVLSLLVYSKFDNFYLSAFLFLTYTNLFLASFNLVRQFTAASIILLGTYYFVMKKKSPVFFAFVFLAFLWHKSSILCVLIYFLKRENFNTTIWVIALILSWIAPVNLLFNIPIIGNLFGMLNYLENLGISSSAYTKTSLANIYMHIMLIVFMVQRRNVKEEDSDNFNIALKLSIISVMFSNISANSLPFAYRYAIYFSVFLPILFSYLPSVINKKTAKVIVFIPITVLLFTVLIGQINNRVFCPQRILPIESVRDAEYHPYINPETTVAW